MSLYGQVRRVASSTFQFDKVYRTRAELEENCTKDGVYAGRYVLVNYGIDGIRYTAKLDDNGNKQYDENEQLIVEESPQFTADAATDLKMFGAVYDSTVWQKIYGVESGEKYIMVAELNSLAPQFELVVENPLEYKNITDVDEGAPNEVADDIYIIGNDAASHTAAIKLEDTYEKYKQPEFDLVHSNELSYYLHLPKPVEVDLANENINYNQKGFDIAYSEPKNKDDYNSFIVWAPQAYKVPELETQMGKDDVDKPDVFEANKKSLYINLPDIGNVVQMFYNVIYGTGIPGEDTRNIRPYFEQYWRDAGDNDDGSPRYYGNDDEAWLSEVPFLDGFLANNTEGLMGILRNLFCERDPMNGTVRYYFNTDWMNSYDYDSNAPYIANKPKVIGYKTIITEYNKLKKSTPYNSGKTYYINDNYLPYTYSGETWSQYIQSKILYEKIEEDNLVNYTRLRLGAVYDANKQYAVKTDDIQYNVYEYTTASDWNDCLNRGAIYEKYVGPGYSISDYKINYNSWTLQPIV